MVVRRSRNYLGGGFRFMMKKSIDLGFYDNVLNGGGACDHLAITTHYDNLICVLLQVLREV